MTQSQSINAHDAEILTLQYSPVLVESELSKSSPLVLLASAGRDRLVHIFDASDTSSPYCHLQTLDNHSSSVTAMTFTSDGMKFITCGGDKTMVFNGVNGKDVTRLKSVQTSNGTINGLAVDATNKFAVTSGQDKRVNIWSVQTAKHVRAYKEDSWGELYKCDIDPSGMFIATCGFDKIIRILDFFSGEIVAQVGGHSELITCIKFSPDGKYLVSVSGDGCIIQWRLGGMLRDAMKERLLELYANAKRKQEKAVVQNVSSLPSTQQSSHERVVGLSNAVEKPIDEHNVVKAARNRWRSRVKDQGGYELFGKKISMSASCDGFIGVSSHSSEDASSRSRDIGNAKVLNKFTIDFNKTEVSSPMARRTAELASTVEAQDDVRLEDNTTDGDSIVVIDSDAEGENSEKENDGLGKQEVDEVDSYAEDFESDPGQEDNLHRASMNIENLERSASALESWLEDKLKSESVLDSIALSSSLSLPRSENVASHGIHSIDIVMF